MMKHAGLYPYECMKEQPHALDRLDLQFRWGPYLIQVLRCHLAVFPPGKVVGFHMHAEYEFHFISKGRGRVILGDREHGLHAGLFYLTGPGVMHYQQADDEEGMDELCLHVQISRLEGEERGGAAPIPGPEDKEAEECVRILQDYPVDTFPDRYDAMSCFPVAYKAWSGSELGQFTTIKQAVLQILLRAARIVTDAANEQMPARDMKKHRFDLAVRFIENNYFTPLKLEDVAEKLHISERQLQRIFTEQGGQSFKQVLEEIRLSRVCDSLSGREDSVERIAAEHGFSSSEYLHYVFKKRYGVTPSQYRKGSRRQAGANGRN